MRSIPLFLAALLALGLSACGGGDDKSFYDACLTGDECPAEWVCPDPEASGNGAIGHVCTPVCESDADCQRITQRTDVSCYRNFCIIECTDSSQCPESQPICRGANPSCADEDLGRLWCATEDFSCDL